MVDTPADPVARQVEWGALEPTRGSNIRTHRIAKTPARWTLKPTGGVLAMVAVAWFFGAFGLIAGGASLGKVPWWGSAVAFGAGTFFASVGALLLRRIERPSFDLAARVFRPDGDAAAVPFGDIHALQLAPHQIEADNERERYWSCELNLVHRDASRTRVLGHGAVDALRCDAQEIATLLDVPLWDGTAKA